MKALPGAGCLLNTTELVADSENLGKGSEEAAV